MDTSRIIASIVFRDEIEIIQSFPYSARYKEFNTEEWCRRIPSLVSIPMDIPRYFMHFREHNIIQVKKPAFL